MKTTPAPPIHLITWRRAAITVVTAAVVVAGARAAFLLSHMMNAVALVGAWVMLTVVAGYVVARFRPAVGAALLIGVGIGAAVVALFAGMDMMG